MALFAVTLKHPVEGASIDAEDLGRACAIAARDFENVKQVASFEFIERRRSSKRADNGERAAGAHLGRLKFLRQVFGNNGVPARMQHCVLEASSPFRYR